MIACIGNSHLRDMERRRDAAICRFCECNICRSRHSSNIRSDGRSKRRSPQYSQPFVGEGVAFALAVLY